MPLARSTVDTTVGVDATRRSRWWRRRGSAWPGRSRTAMPARGRRPSRRWWRPNGRSAPAAHSSPPLLVDPVDLLARPGRSWPAPACCRSGRAGSARAAIARSRNAGHHRPDAAIRSMRSTAAGDTRPATARRRRRGTSAGRSSRRRTRPRSTRSPPAAEVASTSTSDSPSPVPAGRAMRHGHAGRRLVVGEAVGVDAGVGDRPRVRCRAPTTITDGSSRCGRGLRRPSANFDENSPKLRCWLRRSIRPKVAASQNAVVPPLPSRIS